VILRFRDADRTVLAKTKIKIGAKLVVAADQQGVDVARTVITAEVTALEAEFDATGTFTGRPRYDPAHRLFRGRRTETYTQVTASDVAKKVAQRAGLTLGTVESHADGLRPREPGRGLRLGVPRRLAREIGHEVAVKDGKFEFRAPKPAADAPAPKSEQAEPLLLRQGTDLVRFRSVVTSAEQVKEVQVRGWDVAQQEGARRHRARRRPSPRSCPVRASPRRSLAKTFGDPVYVATDVPYRGQSEVDTAAKALLGADRGRVRRVRGHRPRQPQDPRGLRDRDRQPRGARSTASTWSPPRGTVYDQTTGYSTHFAVTGRQERSLFGLASGCRARVGR
jgi:phage protein D